LTRGALLLLLAAALLVRVWRLDAIPPGVWFDEAANTHDALRVWAGEHRIFFTGNLGREPLYIYALAPAFGLFGPGAVALRAVSVAFGMAMVAATYPLGRQLFGQRAALYATALAAFSYWHLHLSRTGFRAISQPTVQGIALAVVWLGFSRGALWPFPVGGALLGLTFYTYSASRFVTPGLLALLVVGLAARRRGREAGALVLAAAAVAAPLALYFWRNPAVLLDRPAQVPFVNPLDGRAALLTWLGSARDVAAMLVVSGDGLARHNLPSRPAFDWIAGALFLLGLPLLLRREWRWPGLFVLGWMLAATFPITFTLENPHFLRSIGLLPAIYLVAGVGAAAVHGWIARLGTPLARRLAPAVVALGLAVSAGATLRDYFVLWPTRADTYDRTMADVVEAVHLLDGRPADRVYLAGDEYDGGPPQPFTALAGRRPDLLGFNGRLGFVYPPADAGRVLYVLPRSGTAPWPRVEPFLPDATLVARASAPDGEDGVRIHAVDAASFQPRPSRPLEARFGDAVELIGYDLPPRSESGATLPVVLYWRAVKHAWYEWSWRLVLLDGAQAPLSPPIGNNSLFANSWRTEQSVATWVDVPLGGAPARGVAYVSLGMTEHDRPVPIFDREGRAAGTSLRLGPTRLGAPPPPVEIPGGLTPLGARFGGTIDLIGFRVADAAARPGGAIEVTVVWRAAAPPAADYTAFVQLLDAGGTLRAQHDARPGAIPTSAWEPGETVVETARLAVPADAPPGPARLIVGLYELPSVRRLALADGRDHETLGGGVLIGR
jgi:4-amino-4-deoxy-L-arabinose transferase-like glycosyltransferase